MQLEKRLPHPSSQLQNISQRLDDISLRMQHITRTIFATKQSHVLTLAAKVHQYSPLQVLTSYQDKCQFLGKQLRHGILHSLKTSKAGLERLAHSLNTVSPLATLDRGYAIVTQTHQDTIVRNAKTLRKGETINTRFASGQIQSTVKKIIEQE